MEKFTVNDRISIICETKNTRDGFKHVAHLFLGSQEVDETKVCYLNRTWESYRYQTVIHNLIKNSNELTEEEVTECMETLK
jgi:hypothetical protein